MKKQSRFRYTPIAVSLAVCFILVFSALVEHFFALELARHVALLVISGLFAASLAAFAAWLVGGAQKPARPKAKKQPEPAPAPLFNKSPEPPKTILFPQPARHIV